METAGQVVFSETHHKTEFENNHPRITKGPSLSSGTRFSQTFPQRPWLGSCHNLTLCPYFAAAQGPTGPPEFRRELKAWWKRPAVPCRAIVIQEGTLHSWTLAAEIRVVELFSARRPPSQM